MADPGCSHVHYDELERAAARDWDPRIAAAIRHADGYGIAEYLAAGPLLLRDWEDARNSSKGLTLGARPLSRRQSTSAGQDTSHRYPETCLTSPWGLPDDPEHARMPREPLTKHGLGPPSATATTGFFVRSADRVEVFDYLADTVQRRAGLWTAFPWTVVRAAIASAGAADANSLASTAYIQGRWSWPRMHGGSPVSV